jgi:16S rRNA (cytidine1402-2'-O)-methyltransferase
MGGAKPDPGSSLTSHDGGAGELFLVATPLGNLQDITLRALQVLQRADIIAAEDTRKTRSLLSAHGIRGRLVSYHEHNERRRAAQLLDELRRGRSVALVSNAGSPLISDPGYHLIQGVVREGLPVCVVPGPSAPVAALQAAGFTSDRFVFHGFVPRTSGRRVKLLEEVAKDPRTQVLFESPHRIGRTLGVMVQVLGDRPVVLCRELTKLHEEVIRGSADEILQAISEHPRKGEMIIVVGSEGKKSASRTSSP